MSERVTCRECRFVYGEDAGDPCPGLCAPCFERGLQRLTAVVVVEAGGGRHGPRALTRRHAERLRALGVTEPHIEHFVRDARAALRHARAT
jgi:hypothetical protein